MLIRLISRDNTLVYMIVLTMCFMDIGLWIFCGEPTTIYSSSSAKSRRHIVLNTVANYRDTEIIHSNLTSQLWNFEDVDIEKTYLYEQLLKKSHAFNETNIRTFRNELQLSMGKHLQSNIIIDQQNTPKNHTFEFGSEKKSQNVKISQDTHKLLPRNITFESIPRCSVVGNSGSILHSKCGNDVDQADFVFRCNAAPIAEYAIDAGNKSNLTTFNPSIFKTRYNKFAKPKDVLRFLKDMTQYRGVIWAPCFSYSSMELCLEIMKTYPLQENNFVLGHPDHFQKIQQFWESRGQKGRLSTGFYIANVALARCREVHLYGFWPFAKMIDRGSEEIPYHYFDQLPFPAFENPKQHNMNSEFSVLLQLHLHGVLRIHVEKCYS